MASALLSSTDIAATLTAARDSIRMNKRHQYDLLSNGKWERLPSVTQILSHCGKGDALVGWAAKCQSEADIDVAWDFIVSTDPSVASKDQLASYMKSRAHEWRRRRDTAADLGTQVHALIENECRRMLGQAVEPMEVTDDARYVFHEWSDWAASVNLEPVVVEQPVFSHSHRYVGTLDLLAYVSGTLCVLDWKTKDKPGCYPEARLQNIAYRKAVAEMGCPEPAGMIVRLPKLGPDLNIEPIEIGDDTDVLYSTFLSLKNVAAWLVSVA